MELDYTFLNIIALFTYSNIVIENNSEIIIP